jgi:probable phosphoglycerate mutase
MAAAIFDCPTPRTTTLVVIRHGETEWNVEGRLQGQIDIPLNDRGREQAKCAAAYLAGLHLPFAAVYASDLSRAAATGQAIADALSVPLLFDSRLRETNLGCWQGQTWDYVQTHQHQVEVRWKKDVEFAMEGGESRRSRFARVANALRDIVLLHPGQRVVVVSHGGVMDEMGRLALAIPYGHPTGLRKFNAAINVMQCEVHERVAKEAAEYISAAVAAAVAGSSNSSSISSNRSASESSAAAAAAATAVPARTTSTAVPPSPLFETSIIQPETASPAVGTWTIVKWGIVDHIVHLHEEEGGHVAEYAASSKLAAGAPAGGGENAAPTAGGGEGGSGQAAGYQAPSHVADEEEAVSA